MQLTSTRAQRRRTASCNKEFVDSSSDERELSSADSNLSITCCVCLASTAVSTNLPNMKLCTFLLLHAFFIRNREQRLSPQPFVTGRWYRFKVPNQQKNANIYAWQAKPDLQSKPCMLCTSLCRSASDSVPGCKPA